MSFKYEPPNVSQTNVLKNFYKPRAYIPDFTVCLFCSNSEKQNTLKFVIASPLRYAPTDTPPQNAAKSDRPKAPSGIFTVYNIQEYLKK